MNLLNIFKDTDDHIDFPAGAIIFEQGATGDFMYVIIAGEVELSLLKSEPVKLDDKTKDELRSLGYL